MVETFYRAFISYSHQDEAAAEWLQRKLETYRVPRKLVDRMTSEGSVPRRLKPLFRDREDFPTSGNLSASVETALKKSRFLIVLCSRHSASSDWVNKEIIRFKGLHGDRRIIAVIVDGINSLTPVDPVSSDECFPPALRIRYTDKGEATEERAEPLAADLRESGDGKKYGLLKIVAGLLGVELDDLVQRDQHRRNTHMKVVTGMASAAAVIMGGLAYLAIDAGNEAKEQKRQAEGLVEFMLTDLKEKMEAVGRLDALESVGEKALDYYSAQDPEYLDADSLARRARAQMLIGEIDRRRNDLDAALKAHEAAAATTEELLSREPNNPQRIFDHAQSVFYVASIADQRRDYTTATEKLEEYRRLALRLVEIDENNPDWRMEVAYATSNLGAMKFRASEYQAAAELFSESVDARSKIFEQNQSDDYFASAYAYALGWMAYAKMNLGEFGKAAETFEKQLAVYQPLRDKQPDDFRLLENCATAYRRLAQSKLALGDIDAADTHLEQAEHIVDRMLAREPKNVDWIGLSIRTYDFRSQLSTLKGDQDAAIVAANKAMQYADRVVTPGEAKPSTTEILAIALAAITSTRNDGADRDSAAQRLSTIFGDLRNAPDNVKMETVGQTAVALAQYEISTGNRDEAMAIAETAIDALQSQAQKLSADEQFLLYKLCILADKRNDCGDTGEKLDSIGFAHPEYLLLRSS